MRSRATTPTAAAEKGTRPTASTVTGRHTTRSSRQESFSADAYGSGGGTHRPVPTRLPGAPLSLYRPKWCQDAINVFGQGVRTALTRVLGGHVRASLGEPVMCRHRLLQWERGGSYDSAGSRMSDLVFKVATIATFPLIGLVVKGAERR